VRRWEKPYEMRKVLSDVAQLCKTKDRLSVA
jgi:hypothetical protein